MPNSISDQTLTTAPVGSTDEFLLERAGAFFRVSGLNLVDVLLAEERDRTINGGTILQDGASGSIPLILRKPSATLQTSVAQTFTLLDDGAADQVYAQINGRIVANGAGAEDGELDFYTVQGGTITKSLVLDEAGDVSIEAGNLVLASGNGIDFSATGDGAATMVNELLDDYEEGTSTLTCEFAAGTGTIVYARQGCAYTKIGNRVFYDIDFQTSDIASRTGAMNILGMPYTVSATYFCSGSVSFVSGLNLGTGDNATILSNKAGAKLTPYKWTDTGAGGSIISAAEWSDNGRMIAGGSYIV